MRRFKTDQEIKPGLVIEKPQQGYQVEKILVDEADWAICEMHKTRGPYAGNVVIAEITREDAAKS